MSYASRAQPKPLLRIPSLTSPSIEPPAAGNNELIDFIRQAKKLLVVTGAGLSTSSGIPAYRNDQGQWLRRTPIFYQDFVSCAVARRRYWARSYFGWLPVSAAQPNAGHYALAQLESRGHLHALITQNVDGLHHRAGSQSLIELHGQLGRVRCLDCAASFNRDMIQDELAQLNQHWCPTVGQLNPDGDVDLDEVAYPEFKVFDCPTCHGPLKPEVVFFGESVPNATQNRIAQAIDDCDSVLVIGSSLVVMSGYRIIKQAHAHQKPIAALNLGRTRADGLLTFKVNKDCVPTLEAITPQLLDI